MTDVDGGPDEELLAKYLADIAQYPPLSPDEERELVRVVRTASEPEAWMNERRLIQSNLRLVVSIAEEYRSTATSFLDLIQEGNLGLLRAVQQYDPATAPSFGSVVAGYARENIERAVDRFPDGAGG